MSFESVSSLCLNSQISPDRRFRGDLQCAGALPNFDLRIHDLQPCQAREHLSRRDHEEQCQCGAGVRVSVPVDCAGEGVLREVR